MPRALHAPRPGDVTELTALLAQSRLTVSQTLYSQGHGTCGTSTIPQHIDNTKVYNTTIVPVADILAAPH